MIAVLPKILLTKIAGEIIFRCVVAVCRTIPTHKVAYDLLDEIDYTDWIFGETMEFGLNRLSSTLLNWHFVNPNPFLIIS